MSENIAYSGRLNKSGTGKTTHLVRQIDRAAEKHGIGKVLVASFTKTAATEIMERAGIKGHEYAGTLHALCYRMLGHPVPAETKTESWNLWAKSNGTPWWQLTDSGVEFDESTFQSHDGTRGDECYRACQTLRARMIDRALWPTDARAFDDAWRRWKNETNVMDFTDMIEVTLRRELTAPGGCTIGFFDGVQDYTKLELALIRGWAEDMETVILAGDDDQCIFSFRGASPDAFLNPPVPDDHKRILAQSFRVPSAVHKYAEAWIRRVKVREPKIYRPRVDDAGADVPGALDFFSSASSAHPEPVVRDIEKQLRAGKSAMVLASCAFHLRPLIAILRREGVPYHNPYRTSRGDWNPLARGTAKRTTALDRVLAFLVMRLDAPLEDVRSYTHKELDAWVDVLDSKILERGTKNMIETLAEQEPRARVQLDFLLRLFRDGGAGWQRGMLDNDLVWFMESVLASKRKTHEYAAHVYRKRGYGGISERPKCIVGTIHSVKGGEADNVYIFPDVSPGAQREMSADPDPILRMFYVAFTRARERLVLCNTASSCAVQWTGN